MTKTEEYQYKLQRLSYLVQLLTFFVTMNQKAPDLALTITEKKLIEKIKALASDELGDTQIEFTKPTGPTKLEVI